MGHDATNYLTARVVLSRGCLKIRFPLGFGKEEEVLAHDSGLEWSKLREMGFIGTRCVFRLRRVYFWNQY